jgi:hypothetical protein
MEKHELIQSAHPERLPVDAIGDMWLGGDWPYLGLYTFACNTRVKADRARKYLSYIPSGPTVFECMEEDLLACRKA